MKKLFTVLTLTLAINFLAVVGGVTWLFKGGRLTRENVHAMKAILFPPPATQPADNQNNPEVAATQPTLKLEDLVARASGRPATEQLELLQRTFDTKMAELDRRERDLNDLAIHTQEGGRKLADDRAAFVIEQKKLADQEHEARKLANDKGFQDSLALYNTMIAKQVKTIFMTLDEPTITQYIQAMQPRRAAAILKEFKTTDELARVQHVMEMMRLAQGDMKE